MSHRTPPSRILAQARCRVTIAVAVLAVPALLAAPASAEPQPWHNPEYVAEASTADGQCDQQAGDKTGGQDSWSTRSRCPVRTTVTSQPQPNKAQIEHAEQLAMPEPNKAQIEHAERLAMPEPNKAQIEHAERLAMPEPNKAQIEHAERLAVPEPR